VAYLQEEQDGIDDKHAVKSEQSLEPAATAVAGSSGPRSTGKKESGINELPGNVDCTVKEEREKGCKSSSGFGEIWRREQTTLWMQTGSRIQKVLVEVESRARRL